MKKAMRRIYIVLLALVVVALSLAVCAFGSFQISADGEDKPLKWSWEVKTPAVILGAFPFLAVLAWILWKRGGNLKYGDWSATVGEGTAQVLESLGHYDLFHGIADSAEKKDLRLDLPRVQVAEAYSAIMEQFRRGLKGDAREKETEKLADLYLRLGKFYINWNIAFPEIEVPPNALLKAELYLRMAYDLNPESYHVSNALGVALLKMYTSREDEHRLADARRFLQRAISPGEKTSLPWFNLGLTYYHEYTIKDLRGDGLRNLQLIERDCYLRSVLDNPNHAASAYNLAYMDATLKFNAEALSYLLRSLDLDSRMAKEEFRKEEDKRLFNQAISELPDSEWKEDVKKVLSRHGLEGF